MEQNRNYAPEYPRIAEDLKSAILKGVYDNKEHPFPSENALAQRYGVSRSTLRKALDLLKREGLIEKSQGRRVQVSLNKLHLTSWNFSSFSEGLKALNDEPYSRVDEAEVVEVNGETFFHLRRTRGVKRGLTVQFLTLEDSWVPYRLFPRIELHNFAEESLYEVMRREYRIYPCKGVSTITALSADDALSRDFDVPLGTALVQAKQAITDLNDRVIEKVTIIYAPELEIRLVRDAGH